MLGEREATVVLAVKNLETARTFYEGTLGLTVTGPEGAEVLIFKSGPTTVNVYRSEFAGTNQATAVTWPVGDDLESIVQALKDKGVNFEHYDVPGMTRSGEVHVAGTIKTAWFKDPDGNILNLING